MSEERSPYYWPLVGGGLLLAAVAIAVMLRVFRPEAPKQPPPPTSPLVTAVPVDVRSGSLLVRGTGTVRPVREIQLTAEVGGRLVSVSDALVSGGRFQAGETLARIDPSDYRSAVTQAEAQVTQAQFQLIRAREEAAVARRDYERIRERTGDAPDPDSTELGRLVFNEPQVAQAEAALASARAALENAETNLARTRLRVPFNGIVRAKQADLGAFVGPGTPVATVYGTDMVEVTVAFPTRKAALIRNLWSPVRDPAEALPATVMAEYGGERFAWDGYVHRVDGAISEQTRTVDVVVRVENPYRAAMQVTPTMPEQPFGPERPPLAVGTYVTVDVEGRRGETYHAVPAGAVHRRTSDQPPVVWTLQGDSLLLERPVQPIQTVESTTFLAPTLAPDTRIITTDLRVQTDSMRVRTADDR